MFDAVYVINLDRSPDRWQALQPILRHMKFPNAVRFSAVDGAVAGIPALQQQGALAHDLAAFNPHCRSGEIGCALSHAAVLRTIVECAHPTALILEDDIALAGSPASWAARAARALASVPTPWELWFLYRCFDIRRRASRINAHTVRPWSPQGCAAYAVSLAGARKLLAALSPVNNAVDRVVAPLVQQRRITAYAASPQLILPGPHPSIINAEYSSKKWVRNGVNRPPEYWPSRYLAHLGEPPEPWPRRLWEDLARRWHGDD